MDRLRQPDDMSDSSAFGFYVFALAQYFLSRGFLIRTGLSRDPLQTVYFERTLSTWHRNFPLGMTPFGLALVVIGLGLVLSLIWLTLIGVALLFGRAAVVMQPPGWANLRWLPEAGGEF